MKLKYNIEFKVEIKIKEIQICLNIIIGKKL